MNSEYRLATKEEITAAYAAQSAQINVNSIKNEVLSMYGKTSYFVELYYGSEYDDSFYSQRCTDIIVFNKNRIPIDIIVLDKDDYFGEVDVLCTIKRGLSLREESYANPGSIGWVKVELSDPPKITFPTQELYIKIK